MHTDTLDTWRHEHVFLGARHAQNERRTWMVVALTATMMVVEVIGGMIYGSMALIADGWHMSTHAGALAVAALAYRFASRHRHNARFAFGTGKVGDARLTQLVREHFDLRPYGIIRMLDLVRPIYKATAAYGHFGRTEQQFTWERTDRADMLREAAGLKLTGTA